MLISFFTNSILILFGSFILLLLLVIGWMCIWNIILYNIPILREVFGLDEPKNKYDTKFTLKYKL